MSISLRGVPLSKLDSIGSKDTENRAYGMAQSAFMSARGTGTSLLSEPVSATVRGPAPYVRAVLTAMLTRHAEGEDPTPTGEDEMRASAEAHMALIEVAAKNIATMGQVRNPSPTLATIARPIKFGVKLSEQPDWLQDSIITSILRAESAASGHKFDPNFQRNAGEDPVLRASVESAFWRGISPFGVTEKERAELKATAFSSAVVAPKLNVPLWPYPAQNRPPIVDEWIETAREQMLGSISSETEVPPPPDEETLKVLVQQRFVEYNAKDEVTGAGAVVSAQSVHRFLEKFDVMRTYGFQSV